jgi:hypothetical protein
LVASGVEDIVVSVAVPFLVSVGRTARPVIDGLAKGVVKVTALLSAVSFVDALAASPVETAAAAVVDVLGDAVVSHIPVSIVLVSIALVSTGLIFTGALTPAVVIIQSAVITGLMPFVPSPVGSIHPSVQQLIKETVVGSAGMSPQPGTSVFGGARPPPQSSRSHTSPVRGSYQCVIISSQCPK